MSAQRKPARPLEYYFDALPDEAKAALKRREIDERAYAILGFLLRIRRRLGYDYAPGRLCTKEKIQKEFGDEAAGNPRWSLRSIQRSLADLKRWGYMEHVDDRDDVTGKRIVFPFLSGRLRLVQGGEPPVSPPPREKADALALPGGPPMSPRGSHPCLPPLLLDAPARSESKTSDVNVNVGCAGGEEDPSPPSVKDGAPVIEFPSSAMARETVATDEPPAPEDPAAPGAGKTDAELDAAVAELDARISAPGPKGPKIRAKLERLKLTQERQNRLNARAGVSGATGDVVRPSVGNQPRPADAVAPAASDPPPDFDAVLRRLRHDSGYTGDAVGGAAEVIATRLKDRHSLAGWRKVCDKVKRNAIPLKVLMQALKMAKSGTADNPGAVAMSYIKKWEHEHKLINI